MNAIDKKLPGFAGMLVAVLVLTISAMIAHSVVTGERIFSALDWVASSYLFIPIALGIPWGIAHFSDNFAGGLIGAALVEAAGVYLAVELSTHQHASPSAVVVVIVGGVLIVRSQSRH